MIVDDLKLIFWRDVVPQIEGFELLSDDMKEYFRKDKTLLNMDEDFINSIAHNEPKGGGKDFKIFEGDNEGFDESQSDVEEANILEVVEAFKIPKTYKGKFSFDSDSDSDDNCIKIASDKQPEVVQQDGFLQGLIKSFGAILNPNSEVPLSLPEIRQSLMDPQILSSVDDLKQLPEGIQQFMGQFPMFQTSQQVCTEEWHDDNQENRSSSLKVPGDSITARRSTTTPILTDTSNQTGAKRRLRSSHGSSLSTSSSNKSHSQPIKTSTPKTTQRPRTKKNLVKDPAVNARMFGFVNKFAHASRGRTSTSPEATPKSTQ